MPDELVTLRQAAHHVGRRIGTLRTWRRRGLFLPVGREKNRDLFRLSEVQAVAARMVDSPHTNHGGGPEPSAEEVEALIAEQSRPENLPAWWRREVKNQRPEPGPPAVLARLAVARRVGIAI